MSSDEYEFETTLDGEDLLVYARVAWPTRSFYLTEPEVEDGTSHEPDACFTVHRYDEEVEQYEDAPLTWMPVRWGGSLREALWDEAYARREAHDERVADGG